MSEPVNMMYERLTEFTPLFKKVVAKEVADHEELVRSMLNVTTFLEGKQRHHSKARELKNRHSFELRGKATSVEEEVPEKEMPDQDMPIEKEIEEFLNRLNLDTVDQYNEALNDYRHNSLRESFRIHLNDMQKVMVDAFDVKLQDMVSRMLNSEIIQRQKETEQEVEKLRKTVDVVVGKLAAAEIEIDYDKVKFNKLSEKLINGQLQVQDMLQTQNKIDDAIENMSCLTEKYGAFENNIKDMESKFVYLTADIADSENRITELSKKSAIQQNIIKSISDKHTTFEENINDLHYLEDKVAELEKYLTGNQDNIMRLKDKFEIMSENIDDICLKINIPEQMALDSELDLPVAVGEQWSLITTDMTDLKEDVRDNCMKLDILEDLNFPGHYTEWESIANNKNILKHRYVQLDHFSSTIKELLKINKDKWDAGDVVYLHNEVYSIPQNRISKHNRFPQGIISYIDISEYLTTINKYMRNNNILKGTAQEKFPCEELYRNFLKDIYNNVLRNINLTSTYPNKKIFTRDKFEEHHKLCWQVLDICSE